MRQAMERAMRVMAASVVLATLPLADAMAQADDRQTVEIQGLRDTRHDVEAACPRFQDTLPEALATAWHRVGREADVHVVFTVDGSRVSEVQTVSGPRAYRRWVVSAVGGMDCRSDRPQPQRFRLTVRFAHPDESRVGLASPGVATASLLASR